MASLFIQHDKGKINGSANVTECRMSSVSYIELRFLRFQLSNFEFGNAYFTQVSYPQLFYLTEHKFPPIKWTNLVNSREIVTQGVVLRVFCLHRCTHPLFFSKDRSIDRLIFIFKRMSVHYWKIKHKM